MEKGLIIGIMGRAMSGKDTFGEILAETLFDITGDRYTLIAFAHELKLMCQRFFDLSYEQLWGEFKEVEDKRYTKKDGNFWTPREILQFVGTECFRSIDPNFWVKNLFRVIEEKEFGNVIITDVRFPEEANFIKDRNGYVINIISDRSYKEQVHGREHASETSLDSYKADFVVVNNSDKQHLVKSAKDVIEFIKVSEKLKTGE